jgi:hypothetical protein
MNKKIATPEKRNLLLSRAKAQIESFTETDALYVPEYDLLERLFGKTEKPPGRRRGLSRKNLSPDSA